MEFLLKLLLCFIFIVGGAAITYVGVSLFRLKLETENTFTTVLKIVLGSCVLFDGLLSIILGLLVLVN